MTNEEYLSSLLPEKKLRVEAYQQLFAAADKLGMARPNGNGGCTPPCGGPGPTPNGSWTCDHGVCAWIPES